MQDVVQDASPFRAAMSCKSEVAGKHWYKLTNSTVPKKSYYVHSKCHLQTKAYHSQVKDGASLAWRRKKVKAKKDESFCFLHRDQTLSPFQQLCESNDTRDRHCR